MGWGDPALAQLADIEVLAVSDGKAVRQIGVVAVVNLQIVDGAFIMNPRDGAYSDFCQLGSCSHEIVVGCQSTRKYLEDPGVATVHSEDGMPGRDRQDRGAAGADHDDPPPL